MTKYERIYRSLVDEFRSGRIRIGQKFYSEAELAAREGVTHVTIRNAFNLLEKDGYIERIKRSGTYVRSLSPREEGHSSNSDGNGRIPWVFLYNPYSCISKNKSIFEPFLKNFPGFCMTIRKAPNNLHDYLISQEDQGALCVFEFLDLNVFEWKNLVGNLDFIPYHWINRFDKDRIFHANENPLSPIKGIPVRYVNRIPIVNLTLARKVGLNTDNLPETWPEVEKWCEKARKAGVERPLLNIGTNSFGEYLFGSYLSQALVEDPNAARKNHLRKKPLLDTLDYFRRLYKTYSIPGIKQHFCSGEHLFSLFEGPWYPHEHQKNSCRFKFAALNQFVPFLGAANFVFTATSFIGVNYRNLTLNHSEKEKIRELFDFICSFDFQNQLYIAYNGNPCQSPYEQVIQKHMESCPGVGVFYHNNFVPVHQHLIPAFSDWWTVMPEINNFYISDQTTDDLWEKIDWMRRRDEKRISKGVQ